MVVLALRRFPATDRMLAPGHHDVMPMMMRPLDHDAHKAERLELRYVSRVVAYNHKLHAARQVFGRGVPAQRAELMGMSRNHSLYGVGRAALAGDRDLHAVFERRLVGHRMQ